jgi:hypothetical protein
MDTRRWFPLFRQRGGNHKRRFREGETRKRSARLRPLVVIVQEFGQLLAQAFIALALMAEQDGAFEQDVL